MASRGWDKLLRYLPPGPRYVADQLSDHAVDDDSIQPSEDPFTTLAGSALASGVESAGRMAAPQLERLLAEDLGGVPGLKKKALSSLEDLNMNEMPRKMRAIDQGFDPNKTWYHGTKADVEAFDPNTKGASTNAGSARQGYFFASDPSTASDYANLSEPRAELRRAAGVDLSESPKTGLSSFYRDDELDRLRRNDTTSTQRWADQLKKNIQFTQDRLDGKVTEKYPPPRDYSLNKLEEYKQKLVDAEQMLKPEAEKARLSRIKELETEVAREKSEKEMKHYGQNVNPAHLKMENPYVHDFKGESYRETPYSEIMKEAKAKGHDSVIFKNTYDPGDPNNRVLQDIAAVFEPNQIRSKFAAFDPKKSGSGNISSALAGVGLGAGALAAGSSEARADQGGSMGGSWRDTIRPIDKPAASWRDTIKPIDGSVPYAASASAGLLSGVPFSSQIGAAGKTAMDVVTGKTDLSDVGDEYRSERDRLKSDLSEKEAANPKTAFIGSLASAPLMPIPSGAKGMAAYGGAQGLSNSKADLTKGQLGQALGDTATGAATGAVVGDAAEQAGKYLSPISKRVGDFLRSKAEMLKEKATGATGKQLAQFRPGTGRYLLDNDIGGAFSGPAGIAQAAEQSMDRSGAEIGNMLENKLSGSVVNRADVIDALDKRIESMANDESQDALVSQMKKIRDGIAAKAERSPTIPIAEAESIKRGFQKNVNYKTAAPDINANNANAAAAYEYRQAVENSAGQKDPELVKKFIKDKQNTSILSPVQEAAEKRAMQLQQSPHGGLLDIAAAGGGGTIGAMIGGPLGAAVGSGVGLAAKGLRPRYASMGAHGSDALAKLVANSPEALGKFAPALEEAATRGAVALQTTDQMLRKKDPDYASTVEQAMSPRPKTVLIEGPDGRVRSIPFKDKLAALAAGGKLVDHE